METEHHFEEPTVEQVDGPGSDGEQPDEELPGIAAEPDQETAPEKAPESDEDDEPEPEPDADPATGG